MDSVGAILKAAREEKKLSPDQVSSDTHILPSYIQAIEENRFQDLPGEAYCAGFIGTLARYYKLDSGHLTAMFRGIPQNEKSAPAPKHKATVIRTEKKNRTPLMLIIVILLIITAAVLSFLMLLFVVGEIIDNKVQSIPLIICIILVTVIVIVLAMLVSIHFDYGFTPAFKLKSAIIKQGFDPDEVNNDFMHATYHDLNLGLMAVGNTYVVVYSSQEFRIIVLENIIKADLHSVRVNSYRAGSITRYYIWLHEKDENHRGYRCADKLTAELLLNRFLIENIPTETFPTGVETPKGIW